MSTGGGAGDLVLSRMLTICNRRGLHARAAAKFVSTAEKFGASVEVVKDGQAVSALSIMGLMMLGAAMGDRITISAAGDGAEAAVGALSALVEAKFGEE